VHGKWQLHFLMLVDGDRDESATEAVGGTQRKSIMRMVARREMSTRLVKQSSALLDQRFGDQRTPHLRRLLDAFVLIVFKLDMRNV
jgi:hypothetical protein